MNILSKSISILLVFLFVCCVQKDDSTEMVDTKSKNGIFFLEMDEYHIQGVNKVNQKPNFPYVEQKTLTPNERIFCFHISEEDKWDKTYTKHYGKWTSISEFIEGGESFLDFTVYDTSSITSFLLLKENNSLTLIKLWITKGLNYKTYNFSNGLIFSSKQEIINFYANSINKSVLNTQKGDVSTGNYTFNSQKTFLTRNSKTFSLPNNELIRTEESCYKSESEISLFWWGLIGPYYGYCEKVACF